MTRNSGKPFRKIIDSEIGTVRKSHKGRIGIALIYPNTYSVGMSNLGFQTVYRLLNEMPDIYCERAFFSRIESRSDDRIRTIESNRSITDFQIIAFSVSFETDFLNLTAVVEKAGLPLQSAARGDPHPLVIAGGVACFLNPEPVAPFIDCFLIGEAEKLLPRFFEVLDLSSGRKKYLKKLACTVPGIYVPKFYTPSYDSDGIIDGFRPSEDVPSRVRRVFEENISDKPSCSAILTSETAFKKTYLIEVSRGCPHGCRFCSAGYIYRPPRFRSFSTLKKNIDTGGSITKKIGFLGAAVSDHPDIGKLSLYAIDRGLDVSFSSLRADSLSEDLVASLIKSGVKTVTIAPEAGSEKMRRIINKGINKTQILGAVETLVNSGIPNLKLYFMIGLPGENETDIEAIVNLCMEIKDRFLKASREKKRIGTITVSVNPFVPKPFTPFQWAAMDDIKNLNRKIKKIRDGLRKTANLRVQAESPRRSFIQALLARGDRRVSDLLLLAIKNRGNWSKTIKETALDAHFFASRERSLEELLPWDFIDHGIHKRFLAREYERARKAETSEPCPMKCCSKCGVCESDLS